MFRIFKKRSTQHLLMSVGLLFLIAWIANQSGIMEGFDNSSSISSSSSSTSNGNNFGINVPGRNSSPNSGSVPNHVQGIKKEDIPPGDEDLYILKSEIVPPVCPQCPEPVVIKGKDCPPCPACERCPEPSYKCEMIPNYEAGASDGTQMPRPFLNDFSSF